MAATTLDKTRVLIVDDVARVREGLRTVLELEEDVEVIGEAANGLQAVELAEQLCPDIVLMDLEMPGLDGFEATRQIKHHRLAKGVVVLTIHGDNHSRKRAASAGVDAFVEKGADVEELVGTIRQVWDKVSVDATRCPMGGTYDH